MRSVLSWSGGKDSAFALYRIKEKPEMQIVSLLTNLTKKYNRVSMHGIRKELLEKQAKMMDINLDLILISESCTNEEYDNKMRNKMTDYKKNGIHSIIFGDLYLEDIRNYREINLEKVDMNAIFPLWGINTTKLAREFINSGFKAILTCVDSHFLDKKFVGRDFDEALLEELPDNIDPCGENGEFHTFVYDAPFFSKPIRVNRGEVVLRDDRFWFIDLIIE
ncbi:MAG: diphthine--ammonia ligase [Candidatus Lokiarchaeota archaeon]|nr:diphthine--ammonia ligase [Candidatus Lokiarchaeota archaeon]MBD3199909.1 diphthine--ammonia ligase [Candidatus Lokiarchaeota archaeon]